MHRKQWIFDMDGTLTDSMTVVWQGAPLELLRRYGREARPGIHDVLLSMGMVEGAEYLIRTYDLPLTLRDYEPAMRQVIRDLYQKVELKPGVREMLARLKAEGARMCICSNTWADQCEEVLTRLGVADYFEFFCTAQGAKSKAHPAVFHEVLDRLGGSGPADAVVCEDAVYASRTAKQCGFYLIDIEDETSAADQPELQRLADQYIHDWTTAGLGGALRSGFIARQELQQHENSSGEARFRASPLLFIETAFPDNPAAPCGPQAPVRAAQAPARRSASRTRSLPAGRLPPD